FLKHILPINCFLISSLLIFYIFLKANQHNRHENYFRKPPKKIIMDATNENLQKKVRSRKVKRRPHDQIIKDLKTAIHRNGCRHLTVGRLFNMFGYKKRGSSNINVINALL